MKIFACLVLFILLGAGVNAQQAPAPAPAAKIFAETSVMSEKIVKGSPFSADAVNESVQMLADGNRIVRSSTNKLYRNSEGRFRREISGGSGGSLGSFYSVGPGITILDPVAGHRYLLDSRLMTARVGLLGGGLATTVAPALPPKPPLPPSAERQRAIEKIQAELNAAGGQTTAASAAELAEKAKAHVEMAKANVERAKAHGELIRMHGDTLTTAQGGSFVFSTGGTHSKHETRTEDLGVQSIEGVEATGTRTVTTIPAGEIGNERPIEIVYEKWYSKELQLVVMSKHSDPRFGEQTYRLTNIVRSEPDPSLFELPSGYKVVSGVAPAYKIGTSQGGQNVIYTKATSPIATTVKATKP
jgi:hypothetical protein